MVKQEIGWNNVTSKIGGTVYLNQSFYDKKFSAYALHVNIAILQKVYHELR